MSPLRALARPLLASVFIVEGIDAIRHPERHAAKAHAYAGLVEKVNDKVPAVPKDLSTLSRLMGAVSVAGGVLLATGKAPRIAALALAAVQVPRTLVGNPMRTAEQRRANTPGLLRDLAVLGGLLLATEDREGDPSLRWRLGNAREQRAEISELKQGFKAEIEAAKSA